MHCVQLENKEETYVNKRGFNKKSERASKKVF